MNTDNQTGTADLDKRLHELRGLHEHIWEIADEGRIGTRWGCSVGVCPEERETLGGEPLRIPAYTESLDAVMPVVEEMRGKGWEFEFISEKDGWTAFLASPDDLYSAYESSLPTAITKALIAAMEGEKK